MFIEEFFWLVALHPVFEEFDVVWFACQFCEGNLVTTPKTLGFLAIYFLGPCPTLGRSQNNHRPLRTLSKAVGAGIVLNGFNFLNDGVQGSCHQLMHGFGIGAFHEVGLVAIADEQAFYFLMTNSRQDCRVSNLVAIEVQDRQYCTIPYGVEELIGVPSCSEGPSFSFPISYDTANYQVRVIKGSPVSMRNRITQF